MVYYTLLWVLLCYVYKYERGESLWKDICFQVKVVGGVVERPSLRESVPLCLCVCVYLFVSFPIVDSRTIALLPVCLCVSLYFSLPLSRCPFCMSTWLWVCESGFEWVSESGFSWCESFSPYLSVYLSLSLCLRSGYFLSMWLRVIFCSTNYVSDCSHLSLCLCARGCWGWKKVNIIWLEEDERCFFLYCEAFQ